MRTMVKFAIPTEKGNDAANSGLLAQTMQSVLAKLQPEAAYFCTMDGKRGAMLFIDIADPAKIVEVIEPLFLNLNAEVDLVPVMTADELRKGIENSKKK